MSKNAFIIKIDSLVDLITNSSSELFVCKTDKTVEFMREFLNNQITLENLETGSEYTYEQQFRNPYVINENNVDEFINNYVFGWGFLPEGDFIRPPDEYEMSKNVILKDGTEIEERLFYREYNKLNEIDEVLAEQYYKSRDKNAEEIRYNKLLDIWKEKYLTSIKQACLGLICLESTCDNSIPYEKFDFIQKNFNASRLHLG